MEIAKIKIYNVEQVAEMLNLSIQAARQYLKNKRILGQKIGNRWFVSEKNIKKFLNAEK